MSCQHRRYSRSFSARDEEKAGMGSCNMPEKNFCQERMETVAIHSANCTFEY